MKLVDVAIGILLRDGKVLICRRPDRPGDPFAGLWEFPGGKRHDNETLADCLIREIREELAVDVRILSALPPIEHQYPSVHVRLHPYLCDCSATEPQGLEGQQLRWIDPADLPSYHFPEANQSLLRQLAAQLPARG